MPGLVFTLLMILFLVVVHEMGHFFAARVFNVPVRSIHIGFGKQIFDSTRSRPRKPGDAATGRVKIVLGWLPLGGYIEMAEPGDAAVAAGQQATAYRRQPVHRRALIALAGPAANLLFAFCLYWLMLVLGTQDVKPVVATPAPNTPAAVAGVRAGDTVMDANGVPVLGWRGVRVALVEHIVSGLPLTLTVRDAAGSVRLLTMDLSHISTAITDPATAAGLRLDIPHIPIVARAGPLSGAVLAMEKTRRMAMLTLRGLGQYVFRRRRTDGNAEPAAHAVTAGNVAAPHPSGFAAAESVSAGWIGLLSFIAYLSINLGIVNLLPLPLLDGGEIVLLYAERVVGHRLSAISRKAWALAGVSALIALAGPAANLLFACCLYWLMLVLGTQDVKPVVSVPAPNTPAAVAGVRAGDTVMDADGLPVLGWRGVRVALVEHIVSGLPLTLTVRDAAGSVRLLTMDLSHISTAITNPATAAGLRLDIPHIPIVARAGPLSGAVLAMENTRRMAMLTLRGLGQYVFRHHRTDGNAEPAAHAVTAGNVTAPHPSGFAAAESVSAGWIGLLSFIAYLSINLGIVNLLPLPLLDGGEIVLLYAERVVGHRLSAISRKAWVLAGVSVVIAVALAALRPV